jgi:probable non-F420 flavinoid oxidoreductase
MMLYGYHASHEQFSPSHLLEMTKLAEQAGFDCAKSSDHFHPWSERQGHSGFAWSWLGSAMEATRFPIGMISAPGYRYHPAVLAQAAATVAQMYPERLWLALGSGEAINEAITGMEWPEKAERNARLAECVAITRALFDGETVTHRGRVTVIEAKLYSRPEKAPLLFGAAVTEASAKIVGGWADGLLTVAAEPEDLKRLIAAFREGGGEGKPVHIQVALSWAPTQEEAEDEALHQWAACSAGGDVNWDIRSPSDFDEIAKLVTPETIRKIVKISDDLGQHAAWLAEYAALDVAVIHLHQVSRNQPAFIEAFAGKVLPQLR